MTHRERFVSAVTHKQPDRAVFDICGSGQTKVDYDVTKDALATIFGISGAKQGNFSLDDRILVELDIDTRLVGGELMPPTSHNRVENGIHYSSWGLGYREQNGYMEICVNPLKGCTIDEMMAYELPDADNIDRHQLKRWAEEAEYLHTKTDYAVVAEHPVYGVFEIGCWLFGFDDYLYRIAAEPEFVHAFSERILAYQKKATEYYYTALGRFIDCTTAGDDFGTQTGPFMSTGMFDEMVKPYMKERFDHVKKYTDCFIKQHTCGSVHNLIPSLIDCGVDILNPIQPGVYMMEPERLKKDFGDKIAFWGGIDTQHLLPNGTAEEVKAEVKRVLSILEPNGGYILSPAHTIQYDVPAENVVAVYDGAKEYYGLK